MRRESYGAKSELLSHNTERFRERKRVGMQVNAVLYAVTLNAVEDLCE
jgi:hypothetical protein